MDFPSLDFTFWLTYLQAVTYLVPQAFSISAVCVMGCRLMLNLPSSADKSALGGEDLRLSAVDGMLMPIETATVQEEVEAHSIDGDLEKAISM